MPAYRAQKSGSGRKAAPFLFLAAAIALCPGGALAAEPPDLVPRTTIAEGRGGIAAAWFAEPTTRYAHGALGDAVEAGALVFRLRDGREARLGLPDNRVFEDHRPRLIETPALGPLAMVVESDSRLGARLAFYGVAGADIVLRAHAPFIGTAQRWLAPIGSGDFDGDGQPDAALIVTPHLSGILRVYRLQEGALPLLAEASGYSNHIYGQPEIVMSAVFKRSEGGKPGDWIVTPDREGRRLVALAVEQGRLVEKASRALPGRIIRLDREGDDFIARFEAGSPFRVRF